jgi:hypothetical protein
VVDALNGILPPKVRAELPAFEAIRTPRGARASALREPWQHQQDVTLNNEGETDLEVPALRITYIHDNAVRSRMILEFAATQANSAYSIYRVASFDGAELESLPDDGAALDGRVLKDLAGLDGLDGLAEFFSEASVAGDDAAIAGGASAAELATRSSVDGVHDEDSFGRRLGHGLRLLLTGRRALLLNVLLWSLLCLPAFLVGRRRYLLTVIGSSS